MIHEYSSFDRDFLHILSEWSVSCLFDALAALWHFISACRPHGRALLEDGSSKFGHKFEYLAARF